MAFKLSLRTQIVYKGNDQKISRAVTRLKRDLSFVLKESEKKQGTDLEEYGKKAEIGIKEQDKKDGADLKEDSLGEPNQIRLIQAREKPSESYEINVQSDQVIEIKAGDPLGFIYGCLDLSETLLGIQPFWFWNDQVFAKQETIEVPRMTLCSKKPVVRYRGWFINDEVLINKWTVEGDAVLPWEMIFEALLRCKGNMVIPGTDKNAKIYAPLASEMGLYITHHHAEPLGAEMFARAYPDLQASYDLYPEKFEQLWEEGIRRQEGQNVIWNLGFRGQGDCPFWESDPRYDTPEKRGTLISQLIEKQYNLLKSHFKDFVCCTNLYGEVMDLYQRGYIHLSPDIIKIWADNGYGKMVSRRQGNHNPRVYALPERKEEKESLHGLYYHVSFYDLQAANHITMLPNSVDFVNRELQTAFEKGAKEYLIVNASNIRPHTYMLDAVRRIWMGEAASDEEQAIAFVSMYYPGVAEPLQKKIAKCYKDYADCMIAYGSHEDEHAGEQFYNYAVRVLASDWMKQLPYSNELKWLMGECSFKEQMEAVEELCHTKQQAQKLYFKQCESVGQELKEADRLHFEGTLHLQAGIHHFCLEGTLRFTQGYRAYAAGDYMSAFYLVGKAAESFERANGLLGESEYGKWKGFYENECFSDIKFTAYFLRQLMTTIRNMGEGSHFYEWQWQLCYPKSEWQIRLQSNLDNRLTSDRLYEEMKNSPFINMEQRSSQYEK